MIDDKFPFHDDKFYGDDYDKVSEMCSLHKDDVFIDIGANIGQEIEYFASKGLFVDSYEPHPELFGVLKTKYAGYTNISLNNAAVYSKNCNKTLYFKNRPKNTDDWFLDDGGSTLIDRKEGIDGSYGTEVRCVDIVDVINKSLKLLNEKGLDRSRIKILKIDVEGAEYHILKRLIKSGMIEVPQFIFFEDHSHRMYLNDEFDENKEYVKRFVKDNNFKFYQW